MSDITSTVIKLLAYFPDAGRGDVEIRLTPGLYKKLAAECKEFGIYVVDDLWPPYDCIEIGNCQVRRMEPKEKEPK